MADHTVKNDRATFLHAQWIHEALVSGGTKPLKMEQLDAAFKRGAGRARTRREKMPLGLEGRSPA
jgi:hypothetical protein